MAVVASSGPAPKAPYVHQDFPTFVFTVSRPKGFLVRSLAEAQEAAAVEELYDSPTKVPKPAVANPVTELAKAQERIAALEATISALTAELALRTSSESTKGGKKAKAAKAGESDEADE